MLSTIAETVILWIGIHITVVASQNPNLLWPLDSQTCELEVFQSEYKHIENCPHEFSRQWEGVSFGNIDFKGSSFVGVRVDLSETELSHYNFKGWIYIKAHDGVLFHYRADEPNWETIVWTENDKIRLYRKAGPLEFDVSSIDNITLNTWYSISMGIASTGYTTVFISGTSYIALSDAFGTRVSSEIPGNLRIGGSFDTTRANFTGNIVCVGFTWGKISGGFVTQETLCKTAAWLPSRSKNNLHVYHSEDTKAYSEPISVQIQCSVIRCVYSCLRNSDCYYVAFDDVSEGCNTCYHHGRLQTSDTFLAVKTYEVKTWP